MPEWDNDKSKEIGDYITYLEEQFSKVHSFNKEMEKMYLLDNDELRKSVKNVSENAIVTLSPDPKVTSDGAIRLLAATDPIPKVPYDKNIGSAKAIAEKIEKFDRTLLQSMSRKKENLLHYDAASSAIIFGQIIMQMQSTKAMVKQLKDSKASKSLIDAAEETAEHTPLLTEVLHPNKVLWDRDEHGLCALCIKKSVPRKRLMEKYGKGAEESIAFSKMESSGMFEPIDTYMFWDRDIFQVGLGDKGGVPLYQEDWDMPFIPAVVHSAGGSGIFDKLEEQIQPFLYTMQKSGMWNRANLYLSAVFTLLFGLGFGPLWIHEVGGPEPEADVKYNVDGPVREIKVPEGHRFTNTTQQQVDSQLFDFAHQIVEQKSEEMTMYKQAMGSPLGKNAPYSMVSLLSQAGRLPLLVPQKKMGWAFGNLLNMAHKWLSKTGGKWSAQAGAEKYELVPGDIPKGLEVECIIDLALPQDRLQESNFINNMSDKLPMRFLLEQANIGNYNELKEELWTEQYNNAMFDTFLEMDIEKMRMKFMQEQQAAEAEAQAQQQEGMQAQMAQQEQMQAMSAAMSGQNMIPQPGGDMMAEATVPDVMQEGGMGEIEAPGVPPKEML
jgi:hypothetical protein